MCCLGRMQGDSLDMQRSGSGKSRRRWSLTQWGTRKITRSSTGTLVRSEHIPSSDKWEGRKGSKGYGETVYYQSSLAVSDNGWDAEDGTWRKTELCRTAGPLCGHRGAAAGRLGALWGELGAPSRFPPILSPSALHWQGGLWKEQNGAQQLLVCQSTQFESLPSEGL